MKLPSFTDPQFLDASAPGGLNPAFSVVAGAFASLGSGAWAAPGLLAPDAMIVAFSGMTANVTLPPPWGLVASGGLLVRAHGTQIGLDTQAYSTSFAPLVPVGTGMVTAYLAATVTQIQQNPFPIPGPPPGHPAYDPNFVPTVGYAAQVYTVALSAVTGGVDNVNTFELFRTTLASGQTSITAYTAVGQERAPNRIALPPLVLASGGALSPWQAQFMIVPAVSGLTFTLPPAAGAGGLVFSFDNPLSGNETISTTGTDVMRLLGVSGTNSAVLPPSGTVALWGNAAAETWDMIGGNTDFSPQSLTGNGYRFFPNGMLEQWGVIGASGNNTPAYFSFPIPFPNFGLSIVISYGAAFPPAYGVMGAQFSGTAGFIAINTFSGGGVNGAYWRAIGY